MRSGSVRSSPTYQIIPSAVHCTTIHNTRTVMVHSYPCVPCILHGRYHSHSSPTVVMISHLMWLTKARLWCSPDQPSDNIAVRKHAYCFCVISNCVGTMMHGVFFSNIGNKYYVYLMMYLFHHLPDRQASKFSKP
jgi:hypothetical protein